MREPVRLVRGFWAGCLAVCLAVMLGAAGAMAVQPDEILKDPKLEARARELSAELRCLVCQNQSIDDSNAPLARDLRLLVRERLQAGETNQQVLDYVVQRYGEFVLLRPPFGWHTLALWLMPLLVLAGGVMLARSTMRRARLARDTGSTIAATPLNAAEKARLDALLNDDSIEGSGPAGSDRAGGRTDRTSA